MTDRSDTRFTIGLVVVALLVAGAGIYLLGRHDSATPSIAAPAKNTPVRPVDVAPRTSGPTRAGAIAVVRRNAVLTFSGQYAAGCMLESPAYQRFDAANYPQGSCAAASEAIIGAVAARGIAMSFLGARIVSFGHGRATVAATSRVGGQDVDAHVFVRYHGGRWWITGGDESGDLGF